MIFSVFAAHTSLPVVVCLDEQTNQIIAAEDVKSGRGYVHDEDLWHELMEIRWELQRIACDLWALQRDDMINEHYAEMFELYDENAYQLDLNINEHDEVQIITLTEVSS